MVQPTGNARRERIAILGGGMGALATAWHLSRTPELRSRYEVTIYQMGWRLGGKLASGRDAANHFRNIEHGLHVWFGFYDNAFKLYQELFRKWDKPADCPWKQWSDAFIPQNLTPFGEEENGTYSYWPVEWPTNPATPGEGGVLLSAWEYIVQLMRFLARQADQAEAALLRAPIAPPPSNVLERFGEALSWHPVPEARNRSFDFTPSGLVHRVLTWLESFGDDHERLSEQPEHLAGLLFLLDQFHSRAREGQLLPEALEGDNDLKRIFKVLDIGTAFVKGILNPKYGILRDLNLDRINHLEFREWLVENGANRDTAYGWSVLRGIYDAMFQYIGGDRRKPSYEAGTAARVVIRVGFTYKGSVMYLIDAGMGETVIAPMYETLLKQGVKFEFFRKVRRLELTTDKTRIARVHLDRQVNLKDGVYRPTLKYKGLVCWPSEPIWEQIENGEAIKASGANLENHWNTWPAAGQQVLEGDVDFDRVVLGISLGGFKPLNAEEPSLAQELIDALPAWKQMTEAFPLVPSVGLQLWLDRDLKGMGWPLGKPAMDAWASPHNVWTDMTQVLAHEGWEGPNAPRSLQYLCGVFNSELYRAPASRTDTQARAQEQAYKQTVDQLNQYAGTIWPEAVQCGATEGGFDWSVLHAPQQLVGPKRLDSQYLRANVDPNDCCECSAKDTSRFRMGATDSGVTNLVLTGGWVRTGINSTCVEAAVMSGMAAARAISGEPIYIVGEHFMAARPEKAGSTKTPPEPESVLRSALKLSNWLPDFSSFRSPERTTTQRTLPDYQSTRGLGEQEMLPPGRIEGARAAVFAMRADADAITRFANDFLGGPTGGALRYSALAPLVMVLFQDAEKMTSLAEATGYIRDKEAAFAVLLWERDRRGLRLPRPVLWMPYVFIDNSIGLVTGLNVWGYRKEIGRVSVPPPGSPESYRADTCIFRTFSPQTRGEVTTLVEVHGSNAAMGSSWTEPGGFGSWLLDRVRSEMGAVGETLERGLDDLKSRVLREHFELRVPVVNLKQFRDATQPTKACYQALIRNEMAITRFKLGGVLEGDYRMNITPCQSHQIVQTLGLPGYRDIPMAFGAWVEMDYTVDGGTELWRAPGL
jgi:uncharacterized protein with NAD-binding domain and iron-sulfur cluster